MKLKVIHGILLAMSLGISCQAIAQTSSTSMRSMQQLDQYPTEPDPGYYDPPTTQPTAPTRTTQTTSYNQTDINANSKSHCVNRDGRGDSTCFSATGHTGTQSKSSPTAITIKPFASSGASCTTPWGQVISDNGEVAAFQSATGTYNYATGSYAGDCLEEQRHCTNGVLSGSYRYQNCEIAPVNGRCGVANGAYYTYPTSGPSVQDQCNPSYTYGGNPPPDESPPSVPATSGAYLNTSSNMYYWTCAGEAGGSSSGTCSAYRRINGQCGSATNTCDLGTSAGVGTRNNYYPNYTCSCSTNTSGTTTCSANPSGNQTCAGAYKDTTYYWSCMGINTGNNASCATNTFIPANNTPPTPPCGASYQPQTTACGTGYTGNQTRTNYVDNCTGNVLTYGTWDRSSCVCSPTYTSGTEYAACPSGYTGNQSRSTSTNSCTGAVTYGSWNTSSCSAVCNPTYTSGTEYAACPSGYTGNQSRTTSTNSCTGAVTYGSWNTSSCTPASTQGTFTLVSRTACTSGFKNAGYYMYATITNTGSGTITGINHGCAGAYTPSGGSTTLAPGQSATYECRLTWAGAYGCAFGFNGTNASNSGVQF